MIRHDRGGLLWWSRCLWRLLWVLIGLALLLWLCVPLTARLLINSLGSKYVAGNVQVAQVSLDYCQSRLALYGIQVTDSSNQQRFVCRQAYLDLAPGALLQRQLHLQQLDFQGLEIHLIQQDPGGWRLAGQDLPTPSSSAPPKTPANAEAAADPWQLRLDALYLQQARCVYQFQGQPAETLLLEQLTVGPFLTHKPQRLSSLQAHIQWQQGQLRLEGQASPVAADPQVKSRLLLQQVPLAKTRPILQWLGLDTRVQGQLSADLQLQLNAPQADAPAFAVRGGIQWQKPHMRQKPIALNADVLKWQGQVTATDMAAGPWRHKGHLQVTKLHAQLPQQRLSLQDGRWDGGIAYHHGGVELQGGLQLQQLDYKHDKASLDATLAQGQWQGTIDWASGLQLEGSLQWQDVLYKQQRAEVAVTSGTGSWNGHLELPAGDTAAWGYQGRLQAAHTEAQLPPWQLDLKHLALSATGKPGTTGTMPWGQWQGDGQMQQLQVGHAGSSRASLVALEQLQCRNWQLQGPQRFAWQELTLGTTQLLTPQGAQQQPVVSWQKLGLQEVAFDGESGLQLQSVHWQQPRFYLKRESGGGLAVLQDISALQPQGQTSSPSAEMPAPKSADDPPASTTGLGLQVAHFQIQKGALTWQDNSLESPLRWRLHGIEAQVKNLDTRHAKQPARFQFQAHPGSRYARLAVAGTWLPAQAWDHVQADIELHALELPPLSPYLEQVLGYHIRSGQAFIEGQWQLANSGVEAENELLLERFHLGAVTEPGQQGQTLELSLPLDQALAFLRNNKDQITLQVPLSGTWQELEVGSLTSVLQKALFKAVQKGVVSYLAPLSSPVGQALLVGKLLKLTASQLLQLDPVTFAPGKVALNPGSRQQLATLQDKLAQRPGLRLGLTPWITAADISRLQPQEPQKDPKATTSSKEKPQPAVLEEVAARLARQRAEVVKDFLISGKVQSQQVLINRFRRQQEANGPPRVELSF